MGEPDAPHEAHASDRVRDARPGGGHRRHRHHSHQDHPRDRVQQARACDRGGSRDVLGEAAPGQRPRHPQEVRQPLHDAGLRALHQRAGPRWHGRHGQRHRSTPEAPPRPAEPRSRLRRHARLLRVALRRRARAVVRHPFADRGVGRAAGHRAAGVFTGGRGNRNSRCASPDHRDLAAARRVRRRAGFPPLLVHRRPDHEDRRGHAARRGGRGEGRPPDPPERRNRHPRRVLQQDGPGPLLPSAAPAGHGGGANGRAQPRERPAGERDRGARQGRGRVAALARSSCATWPPTWNPSGSRNAPTSRARSTTSWDRRSPL